MPVLAVLLTVLAALFVANRSAPGRKVFRIIPLLVFAYFVPTILSNSGVIPKSEGFELYGFIKAWLLPASLILLTLSVDIPGILRLGPKALALFLVATVGIVLGGPLAYLLLGGFLPAELGDQAWRGLAALSGSWIGGGANFIAVGTNFGADENTISAMVVVDVAVANVWMAILLGFAGREKAMDEKIGADRSAVDALREKMAAFQAEIAKPTTLPDLLSLGAIAFGVTAVSRAAAYGIEGTGWSGLPQTEMLSSFAWMVILATTAGVGLSYTRLRHLEGVGASAVGSVMLYLLVASIGAKADFGEIWERKLLLAIGAVWMVFHASTLMLARRVLKAPIFFAAVGSQANVGGAASAPVVAAAFHPSLAPVGVLLGVGGYVLGTYAGLLCGVLLKWAHGVVG
jgi:uncharacterized membrane protein